MLWKNITIRSLCVAFLLLVPVCAAIAQPTAIKGSFNYKSLLVAKYFGVNSTPALLCVSRELTVPSNEWVPNSEQVLGRYTKPIYPSPIEFEIPLPVKPVCKHADLDNNGRADAGVQIFATVVGINLFGDNYLEQLEQAAVIGSYLSDVKNKTFKKGSFVVFAPDSNQQVPSGFGPDRRLFTADDPTVGIPAGYSLMKIGEDRSVTFDRSPELRVEILQEEESTTTDLSSMGLVQAFDALIDLLKERYAYTDVRKIDWEQTRTQFRPRVADAEKREDLQDYYLAIYDLAASLKDGHVQTGTYDPKLAGKRLAMLQNRLAGGLGAQIIRYSDGRFIVYSVGPNTPAAEAGIEIGAEIVRIDGKSVPEHLESIPPVGFAGTDEIRLARKLQIAFSFPSGRAVNVEFKKAGGGTLHTARLVAREVQGVPSFPSLFGSDPVKMGSVGEDSRIGYFRWANFEDVSLNIAAFETFLSRNLDGSAIILDVRGNGGGLLGLMYTMASYLFPADKPISTNWLDSYVYDEVTKTFIKAESLADKRVSSPRPALTFNGKVVILVDGESASEAEFFAQYLQKKGRAIVVADSGTDGAGGTVRQVILPGKLPFTYTGGQMFFAGTKEVNLEGRGVTPDVRVPIDDEYVTRRLQGEDVVLKRAVELIEGKTQLKTAPLTGGENKQ